MPQFLFSRKPQMNNWVETWYGFYRRQSKICFQETISTSSGSIFKVSLGSIQWLCSVHKADLAKIFPTRSILNLHLNELFANEPLELRVLLRQTCRYFLPSSFIWRHASFLRMKYSSSSLHYEGRRPLQALYRFSKTNFLLFAFQWHFLHMHILHQMWKS